MCRFVLMQWYCRNDTCPHGFQLDTPYKEYRYLKQPCLPALQRSVEKIKLISGYGDGIACPDVEGMDEFKYEVIAEEKRKVRRCRGCRVDSGKTPAEK
jgi:hypothetical protein